MTDEVIEAGAPAPEPTPTATPEPGIATPEPQEPTPAAKTFTQEEVDAIVGKRLAREQRKWERDQQQRMPPVGTPVASAPSTPLTVDQFETPEAYAEALANVRAQELVAQREQERQQRETLATYHEREEKARETYDDFAQVAYNPNLSITTAMAQAIQASDVGPDVAYYLGTNPQEADRISRLSPFLQAKEIGRIEAKVAAEPPAKKTTSAPAPITPVKPAGGSPVYDTTDPRSIQSMSTSEWIAAERQRQIRNREAARKR